MGSETSFRGGAIRAAGDVPRKAVSDPIFRRLLRTPTVVVGIAILCLVALAGICAPLLTPLDPAAINPAARNKTPGAVETVRADDGTKSELRHWMGTDSLGRDVYARAVYGARASLAVGALVALVSVAIGLVIGLVAGYVRWLDGPVMRLMDGLMAIPAILLAIAVVSLSSAGLAAVIVAIVVPEVPRVVRLVRSVVLSVREEPYVEAAIALDTPTWRLMLRHILPNAVAPLIVHGTFVCAAAMLVEAAMSFLGIGLPPDIPSWGNIMADGRAHFSAHPHTVLLPGGLLALAVLAVNMLGDGLRDTLDPKFNQRGG